MLEVERQMSNVERKGIVNKTTVINRSMRTFSNFQIK